jgi:hypothetical protein
MGKDVGTRFYTYKKRYQLMVLAVCDTQSKFTYVSVGKNGRAADSTALAESDLATCKDQYFGPKEYLLGDSGFACSNQLVCMFPRPPTGEKAKPYQVSCTHCMRRTRDLCAPPPQNSDYPYN